MRKAKKLAFKVRSLYQRGITAIEYGVLAAGMAVILAFLFGPNGTFKTALTDSFAKVTDNIKNIGETDEEDAGAGENAGAGE